MTEEKKVMRTKKAKRYTVVTYTVGDFLIQFKNAALARKNELVVKNTKFIEACAKGLKAAGYADRIEVKDGMLKVGVTFKTKKPVMMGLKLISKPGLRLYSQAEDIKAMKSPSTYLVSTPKGVLTNKQAVKENVGGEMIAEIW